MRELSELKIKNAGYSIDQALEELGATDPDWKDVAYFLVEALEEITPDIRDTREFRRELQHFKEDLYTMDLEPEPETIRLRDLPLLPLQEV